MGPDPPTGRGNFGEKRSGPLRDLYQIWDTTLSCAKTAEPIEIPFWKKTQVGPRYHVLDGVHISRGEWAILAGCPGHSKALAIFAAAVIAASRSRSLQKGSVNRHYVMQQKGSFSMPGKRK